MELELSPRSLTGCLRDRVGFLTCRKCNNRRSRLQSVACSADISISPELPTRSMQKITTFLMFDGNAEEAINFYLSVFPGSAVRSMSRFGADGPGKPGTVQHATFSIGDQQFMAIDSVVKHAFTFTPAMSMYVACGSANEVDVLYSQLARGGRTFMPANAYPFSQRYAWLSDRFGVSWQLAVIPA